MAEWIVYNIVCVSVTRGVIEQMGSMGQALDSMLRELTDQVIEIAPTIAVGLLVFFAFWFTARLAGKLVRRIAAKAELGNAEVFGLLAQTVKITLLIFGGITALGTAGVNVTALVAGLGLTGFALGFALKDAISNLLAGVLILIYRPFVRNDRIKVAGYEGKVVSIDLRYTILEGDGGKILVPNAVLFNNAIVILPVDE